MGFDWAFPRLVSPRQNQTCWLTLHTAWQRRAWRSGTSTTWSWGKSSRTSWLWSDWIMSSQPTAMFSPLPLSVASSAPRPPTCWGMTRHGIASGPGPAPATVGFSKSPGFFCPIMRKPRWVKPALGHLVVTVCDWMNLVCELAVIGWKFYLWMPWSDPVAVLLCEVPAPLHCKWFETAKDLWFIQQEWIPPYAMTDMSTKITPWMTMASQPVGVYPDSFYAVIVIDGVCLFVSNGWFIPQGCITPYAVTNPSTKITPWMTSQSVCLDSYCAATVVDCVRLTPSLCV